MLPARWQSSRVTSGVSFVPAGRDINFKVAATLLSESTFRNGDWLQRDAERGLERVVEDRIAGGVGKIGQDDGVFLG